MNCLAQSQKEIEKLSLPPQNDELEITVFGPGIGEAIVVHLGNGDWIIVDSCRSPLSKRPVPLEYLELLGVDVSTKVIRVIATHWHDDHVAGLSEVVELCGQATVWLTPAIKHDELITLIAHYSKRQCSGFGSGVDEMSKVLEVIRKRSGHFQLALENTSVIHTATTGGFCEIICLAPSATAITNAQIRTAQELKSAFKQQLRLPSFIENDGSIVLRIKAGNHLLLLGGDLEEKGNPSMGWLKAISTHLSLGSARDVQLFKIPHHGSINGYHPPIWSTVLQPNPWALITPYRRGQKPLPAAEGLAAIAQHTDRIYVTAATTLKKVKHSDQGVHKTTQEVTVSGIREAFPRNGAVRLRCKITDPGHVDSWRAETFGSAFKI